MLLYYIKYLFMKQNIVTIKLSPVVVLDLKWGDHHSY